MKTFYEIMEEKDLNNLTPLEYAIWFLESATGASGAQQAAADLARLQRIEAMAILCVDRWNECETDSLLDTDMPKLAVALKQSS